MLIRLLRNQWVAGVTTSMIAGIIIYFVLGIGRPTPNPSPTNLFPNSQSVSISPQQIADQIESQPPYLQEATAQSYKGISVTWTVEFYSITTIVDEELVTAFSPGRRGPVISFFVNLDDYPQFKILKRGQRFATQGTIESATAASIALENCSHRFK